MVSHLQRRDQRSADGGIFEARALRLRSGLGPSSGPSNGDRYGEAYSRKAKPNSKAEAARLAQRQRVPAAMRRDAKGARHLSYMSDSRHLLCHEKRASPGQRRIQKAKRRRAAALHKKRGTIRHGGIFEARALRLRSGLGPSSGPSDGNRRIERQSGVETPHSTKSTALRRRRLPAHRQPQENVSELV
jgi:hypothetical protein